MSGQRGPWRGEQETVEAGSALVADCGGRGHGHEGAQGGGAGVGDEWGRLSACRIRCDLPWRVHAVGGHTASWPMLLRGQQLAQRRERQWHSFRLRSASTAHG